MLAAAVAGPLRRHLALVRETHRRDITEGYGRVPMADALERRYPNAARSGNSGGSSPRLVGGGAGTLESKDVITLTSPSSSVRSRKP